MSGFSTRKNSCGGQVRLAAFAIGAVVLVLTFATNFDGAFVLDDRVNLTDNPSVTQFDPTSLGSWQAAAFESPARLRPIPYLTFAWEWYLFGGNPAALHFLSDLFHALAAVVLFFLLLEFLALHYKPSPPTPLPITGRGVGGEGEREGILLAATGALLWALHPVQTSAVTYLVQRMAVLSGLFQLVALWFYLRGRRTGEGRNCALAALAYLCALFSKENAAALPMIVLAYEWLLGPAEEKPVRFRRIGLLLLVCVPPVLMAMTYGAMESDLHFRTGSLAGFDFTLGEKILSAPRMYFKYLGLLAFPYPQAFDHGVIASKALLEPPVTLIAWLLLGVLSAGILFVRRRFPGIAFAVLAFALALGPETTFLNIALFYEHRVYLASTFLIPLLPLGIWEISRRMAREPLLVSVVLAGALVMALSILTGIRNREWRDGVGLTQLDAARFPESWHTHFNLGVELLYADQVSEATELFRQAHNLNPENTRIIDNLAASLGRAGRFGEAIQVLENALRTRPNNPDLLNNLGTAYAVSGQIEEAIPSYEKAVALSEDSAGYRMNLARAYLRVGREEQALAQFNRIVLNDPENAMALSYLGRIYQSRGQGRLAEGHFAKACALGDRESCGR